MSGKDLDDAALDAVSGGWVSEYQAAPELDAKGSVLGPKPSDACFVKADSETTTQSDTGETSSTWIRVAKR